MALARAAHGAMVKRERVIYCGSPIDNFPSFSYLLRMKKFIFDSSALIPASKFGLAEKSVCEHLTDYIEIHIPTAVQQETQASPEKFAGGAVVQRLITQQKIVLATVQPTNGATEILSTYRLGLGEQEAILLFLQNQEKFDGIILDDYVATIVCRRLQIGAQLLLDLIVQLEREQIMPHDLAVAMIAKIAPRYHRGFVEHSLQMLGERGVLTPPVFVKEHLERFLAGKLSANQRTSWWQRFAATHRDYAAGLISFGWMAQNLHATVAELDGVFDEIKLPFSTTAEELFELWEPYRASQRWLQREKHQQESL